MNHRRNFLKVSTLGAGTVCASAVLSACGSGHAESVVQAPAKFTESELAKQLKKITSSTVWTLTAEVPLSFNVEHPQSIKRINGLFYMSSVEITVPTTRYPALVDGYDRDTGEGKGHLFVFDAGGRLQRDIVLGEGTMYHPGGIDFDGQSLWVPCAEYRPNSRSVIYKVDVATSAVTRVAAFQDHLGGISLNTDTNTLHAVSWGSRRFYKFALDGSRLASPDFAVAPELLRQTNRSFYIDYQENQYLGGNEMLFTGVSSYRSPNLPAALSFGGFEIVDLATGLPTHLVPIRLWSPRTNRAMTQNPCTMELIPGGVRAYFVPDDDNDTRMYVYEAKL
jgi:Family of unknown function (DUF6454)